MGHCLALLSWCGLFSSACDGWMAAVWIVTVCLEPECMGTAAALSSRLQALADRMRKRTSCQLESCHVLVPNMSCTFRRADM